MKKKIAICIPSFNESHIISSTLRKVDGGLKKYIGLMYDVIIVNIDNNSLDNTSEIFMDTYTTCPKISIKTTEPGKGVNLLKFFKYCYDNKIDYAMTIDADVKSLKSNWIDKFLEPLINNNYDYVTPIYKRSRYEGSTTNHFAFPLIYAIFGLPIRQPLAGDFSFNKKFIEIIVKQPITDSTKKYGIDIFMTLTACYYYLNVFQVNLEKKIHNPSYCKMENMFQEVLDSFLFTWKNLIKDNNDISLPDKKSEKLFSNSIIRNRKFSHKIVAKNMYNSYSLKVDTVKDIEDLWLQKLKMIALEPNAIDNVEKDSIFNTFMVRATKFWLNAENCSALTCEKEICKQANILCNMLRRKECD